jgi:hypothetical protein
MSLTGGAHLFLERVEKKGFPSFAHNRRSSKDAVSDRRLFYSASDLDLFSKIHASKGLLHSVVKRRSSVQIRQGALRLPCPIGTIVPARPDTLVPRRHTCGGARRPPRDLWDVRPCYVQAPAPCVVRMVSSETPPSSPRIAMPLTDHLPYGRRIEVDGRLRADLMMWMTTVRPNGQPAGSGLVLAGRRRHDRHLQPARQTQAA